MRRYAASSLALPSVLLILLTIVTAASLAHALLSSQEQRARTEAPANGVVVTGEEEAAENEPAPADDVEQQEPPLPPPPSEELISDMNQQHELSAHHYRFWNVTDSASCSRAAEQLNNETRRRARSHSHREEHHQSCTPTYSCDFDRLRFPHWLVFTSCSLALCDPAARPGARCVAHEEFVVMLRYIERDRSGYTSTATTRSRRSVEAKNGAVEAAAAAATAAAGGLAAEKHAAHEKGEWRLWFVDVPSECRCVQ